jgi:hypothetical protein
LKSVLEFHFCHQVAAGRNPSPDSGNGAFSPAGWAPKKLGRGVGDFGV